MGAKRGKIAAVGGALLAGALCSISFGDQTGASASAATASVARAVTVTRPRLPRIAPPAQAEPLPAPGEDRAAGPVDPDVLALGGGRQLEVARGEVLLRFRPDTPDEALQAIAARHGLRFVQRSRHHDVLRARVTGGADLGAALAALTREPAVLSALPNAISHGAGQNVASARRDAFRRLEWDTASESPGTRWRKGGLRVDRAPVVALLDSGVAFENYQDAGGRYALAPDLACTPFAAGYDFVNGDAHPDDDHQHGTHLAALIAADADCGSPLSGWAPGAAIMPVKVLDRDLRGTEMMLIEGLDFAVDHGADVVNMSLSFGPDYFPSPDLAAALRRAADEGVVLVGASGNAGVGVVGYPAAAPDVIAVGAFRYSRHNGDGPEIATDYSQWGAALDVLGPGGDLDRDENHDGFPDGLAAQTFTPGDPTAFGFWVGAGTSQAAAAVSGLAARMLAQGLDPALVRAVLVRDTDRSAFTDRAGRGAVRPDQAERDANCHHCGDLALPSAYVNLVGALERAGDDVRARVAVQVVGADEAPLARVSVHGHWIGAASGNAACTTDAQGACRLASPAVPVAAGGVLVGFHADTVVVSSRDGDLPVRPLGFFRMDRDTALAVAGADPGVVAFAVNPEDAATRDVFASHDLLPSAMVKDLGPASGVTPFVMVIDPPFGARFGLAHPASDTDGTGLGASSLTFDGWLNFWNLHLAGFGGNGLGASSITWQWYGLWTWNTSLTGGNGLGASSFSFPWYQSWSLVFGGAGLGASSITFNFGNWMFLSPTAFSGNGLGASSLVINGYWQLLSTDNSLFWTSWGNGLGASSITTRFSLLLYSSFLVGLEQEELRRVEGLSAGLVRVNP